MPQGFIPPYPPQVPPVSDGEPVKATVTNKGPDALTQRTDHLKARLDAVSVSSSLVITDMPLFSDPNFPADIVQVGNLVYRDTASNTFKKALAAINKIPNSNTGIIDVADSSYVWGVVLSVTAGYGTILLGGVIDLNVLGNAGKANLIEDLPGPGNVYEPGAYYLSSITAGKASKTPKIAGLFQFFLSDDGTARFLPAQHGILESHIHFTLQLEAHPAGDANCVTDVDDVHTIINPDANLPGWLPADDPVFMGAAPANAKFGYNIGKDNNLKSVWPPVPISGAFLVKNGGIVPPSDIYIDNSGIWWLKDDYGNVPWPVDECGAGSSSTSDPLTAVELQLFTTEFVTRTGDQFVTRLRLKDNEQNLILYREDSSGNLIPVNNDDITAGFGPLRLALDLKLTQGVQNETGPLVVKTIADNVANRGPVVEKIVAGDNIVIQNQDPSVPQGQGTVKISASLPPSPEQANLSVGVASPSTGVIISAGSVWTRDGNRYVNVPAAVNTGPIFPIVAPGFTRYDLIVMAINPATLATTVSRVAGTPVTSPGDPFANAPWDIVAPGSMPLAIIKIDETVSVDIKAADITNLKSLNSAMSMPQTAAELRKDALDASGAPAAAGSLEAAGLPFRAASIGHSHPPNVGTATPLADSLTPSPGTSTVVARDDHAHLKVDALRKFINVYKDSATVLSLVDAVVHDSMMAKLLIRSFADPLLTLNVDPTKVNAAPVSTEGYIVYTDNVPGTEPLKTNNWHALYLVWHPTNGYALMASVFFDDYDNIEPTGYGGVTIHASPATYAKRSPPMPTGWSGSLYRRIGFFYLTASGQINNYQAAQTLFNSNFTYAGNINWPSVNPAITLWGPNIRWHYPPGSSLAQLALRFYWGFTPDKLDDGCAVFPSIYTAVGSRYFPYAGYYVYNRATGLNSPAIPADTSADFAAVHTPAGQITLGQQAVTARISNPEQRTFLFQIPPYYPNNIILVTADQALGWGVISP